MEVIIILLPLAVILGLVFIGGFVWMTYQGQYDDLKSPKYKMLLDDYSEASLVIKTNNSIENQNRFANKKKDGGDELNGH